MSNRKNRLSKTTPDGKFIEGDYYYGEWVLVKGNYAMRIIAEFADNIKRDEIRGYNRYQCDRGVKFILYTNYRKDNDSEWSWRGDIPAEDDKTANDMLLYQIERTPSGDITADSLVIDIHYYMLKNNTHTDNMSRKVWQWMLKDGWQLKTSYFRYYDGTKFESVKYPDSDTPIPLRNIPVTSMLWTRLQQERLHRVP